MRKDGQQEIFSYLVARQGITNVSYGKPFLPIDGVWNFMVNINFALLLISA